MRVTTALVAGAFVLLVSVPAMAHEGEEEVPAATTVEEAIAIIASQPEQVDAIEDKIMDAQESDDTDGVDVALVKQAGAALDEGDMDTTMLLLERSIGLQPGAKMTDPTSGLLSPAPAPPSQQSAGSPLLAEAANRSSTAATVWLLVLAAVAIVLGALAVRTYR